MAYLTNLDAIRGNGLDEIIRRVHQNKEDVIVEDLTMPVVAIVDIDKYQRMGDQQGGTRVYDSGAEPRVRGSDVTIREIAEWHLKGDSPADLMRRFSLLNPGQIYGALAYYYDHTDEIDRLITAHHQKQA